MNAFTDFLETTGRQVQSISGEKTEDEDGGAEWTPGASESVEPRRRSTSPRMTSHVAYIVGFTEDMISFSLPAQTKDLQEENLRPKQTCTWGTFYILGILRCLSGAKRNLNLLALVPLRVLHSISSANSHFAATSSPPGFSPRECGAENDEASAQWRGRE